MDIAHNISIAGLDKESIGVLVLEVQKVWYKQAPVVIAGAWTSCLYDQAYSFVLTPAKSVRINEMSTWLHSRLTGWSPRAADR